MDIAIAILYVTVLCGMTFTWGFFIGKGKIEIQRKLTVEERKLMEETAHKQQEAIEKYNKALNDIVSYNALDGDE